MLPVALRAQLFEALEPELRPLQISRRAFLELTAVGAVGAMLAACTPALTQILDQIRNRPVRRDVSSLPATDPVLNSYRAAITAMKALPTTDPRNWINQANIHANFCPHGNWLFLPWHREYLRRFEEICRQLANDNSFALPYWNWSKSPQIPGVFFDTTSSLYDASRSAQPTSTISAAIVGPNAIETILDQTNFLLFGSGSILATDGQRTGATYGQLEAGPHNSVHGFVGGNMGFVGLSPRDPIFWMHHNMIECIWIEWNWKRNNPNTNDAAWTGRRFTEFSDRTGAPVSVTSFDMILYPLFLYRYDDPILGVP
jgi:tyrosinase